MDAMEIQKLPCPAVAMNIRGTERSEDKVVIQPLTIGFFDSSLSPMIPANRFEVKPQTVKMRAFKALYCTLKAGYVLRKNTGRKLAMIASEKCLITPPAVMRRVVGFLATSEKDETSLLKNGSFFS